MIFALIAGSLIACGDKTEDTGSTTAVTSCPDGATITITETTPISGASDFFIADSISFELTAEDPSASISLSSADGDVAGSSSVDGATVTFTPDAMLVPSTEYTASLTYCGDTNPVDVAFTTSDLGSAVSDSLAGKTFAVDIGSGTFVQPPGVGALIGEVFSNNILLGIKDDQGGELAIRGALSIENEMDQDMCTETLEEFPAADFSNNPFFEIPEGDVTLSVAGVTATIYGLNVSGVFSPDGSYFGGGELRGALDARDLVSVVGELGLEVSSADEICDLVAGFGVPCEPCADGEDYCVGIEVVDLVANETGTELVQVTAEDIEANGSCAAE